MRTEKATQGLTIILLVNVLLPSFVFAQNPTSEDYAARSRTLIETDLKKLPNASDDFRIELIGDPNGILDHTRFHGTTPQPPADRASLSGRVVNSSWQNAAGVRVLLTSGDASAPRSAVTSAIGEFRFPDLAPGDYQLRLDGNSKSEYVRLEAGNTRILVPAGGTEGVIPIMGNRDRLRPRVLARVYQANKLQFSYRVDFNKTTPDLQRIDLTEMSTDFKEFGSLSLPTESESKQLKTELTPLLTALMDVGKGPERLKPFFSAQLVCRMYDSGEPVRPLRDNQSCALYLLDMIALTMWFQMESPEGDPPQMATPWREVPETTSDAERITLAARRLDILRQELRSAGLFEPQHAARVQQYYVEFLSNFGITKLKSSGEIREFPLPKGELFRLSPFPLFLIRDGARLKIVGFLLAGG